MMSRLFPILILLGTIGLFVGYVHPTYTGAIQAVSADIQSYDAALAAADRFKAKELQLTGEKNSLPAAELERLESFLPDSVDNVQLILDLNSLAARSGVQLSDFDTTETGGDDSKAVGGSSALTAKASAPYDTLELSVSAVGSYAAFRTFIAGVEQSLRPLDVVEMSLKDSQTGVYTYDVTFRLYWLR